MEGPRSTRNGFLRRVARECNSVSTRSEEPKMTPSGQEPGVDEPSCAQPNEELEVRSSLRSQREWLLSFDDGAPDRGSQNQLHPCGSAA